MADLDDGFVMLEGRYKKVCGELNELKEKFGAVERGYFSEMKRAHELESKLGESQEQRGRANDELQRLQSVNELLKASLKRSEGQVAEYALRLDTYEKWFSDNAVNLAVHNIGGFSMSPYGAAVRADTFPEPVVEIPLPKSDGG